MNIVLLGPPGAGKGTQAKLLREYFGLWHISTGDLLRKSIADGTKLGSQAKEFIEKGDLVPDNLVVELLKERLAQPGIEKGFILDGFPRNDAQAGILDAMLKKQAIVIDYVLYLEADEPIIIQRLSGRRVCKNCQQNYHVTNMPSQKDGICDTCSGLLYQRPDDREEAIKNRLLVYLRDTKGLVDYYRKQGKLLKVDANFDAPIVFDGLKKVLL